jgi:ABC-2 type transport system permease protein
MLAEPPHPKGGARAIAASGIRASLDRIGAMVLRYVYLIRGSFPRMLELMYWPLVQMLLWGFVQMHLAETANLYAKAGGLLVGCVLLWDILLRSQFGFSLSFLEEIWSKNIGNILMSPITPNEFVAALMVTSIIRLLIGLLPVVFLANWFFGFNLFGLGLPLAAFFANLVMMGWAIGLLSTGLVMRYGLGAESFAWTAVFFLLPLSCVYYPLSTLPTWLHPISQALPSTHVFEGLRAILVQGEFRPHFLAASAALNVIYFTAAFVFFRYMLWKAREHGSLLQMGE